MPKITKNDIILLTGSSTGIGFQLADQLSRRCGHLILVARSAGILATQQTNLTSADCKVSIFPCDVSDQSAVRTLFATLQTEGIHPTISILNAAISSREPLISNPSASVATVFSVNVMGVMHILDELLPLLIQKGSGTIVGVSSLADGRGFPKSGAYCASKAALSLLLEALRLELAPKGIRVLTVKPGFVRTPMTDKNEFSMPMLMEPDKAAQIIINGIEKNRKVIAFPAPTQFGAGLLKMMPTWLFDRVAGKYP